MTWFKCISDWAAYNGYGKNFGLKARIRIINQSTDDPVYTQKKVLSNQKDVHIDFD